MVTRRNSNFFLRRMVVTQKVLAGIQRVPNKIVQVCLIFSHSFLAPLHADSQYSFVCTNRQYFAISPSRLAAEFFCHAFFTLYLLSKIAYLGFESWSP